MGPRIAILLAAGASLIAAGCGAGDGDSGSADPASLAPPDASVFIETAVQLEGSAAADVNALAQSIAGIDDLGGFIVEKIEDAADSDSSFDYEQDLKPWLGEKAGLWLRGYDGDDLDSAGLALQSTDTGATEDFIATLIEEEDEDSEDGSYEGVDYKIDPDDGEVVGVLDDFFVFADGEDDFKAMVDASNGDSLADEETFTNAIAEIPAGSVAGLFVDIGGLVEESGGVSDAESETLLEAFGLSPESATVVAGLVPGSDRIEVDFSTDVGGGKPASVEASELLGSLPASAAAALATSEFGPRFEAGVNRVDQDGVPSEDLDRGELGEALEILGVEPERIGSMVGDVALFAEGSSERNLAATMVLETKTDLYATTVVGAIGFILRGNGITSFSPIGPEREGLVLRTPELGGKPLAIAARDRRVVVAYGTGAVARALGSGSGRTLADDPTYREAVTALDGAPIAAFLDGPQVLRLVSDFIPDDDRDGFSEAEPYLEAIEYGALTVDSADGLTTAKLIVGIGE